MELRSYRLTTAEVLFHNSGHILGLHPAIPEILWQYAHRWPQIALPLTSGTRNRHPWDWGSQKGGQHFR